MNQMQMQTRPDFQSMTDAQLQAFITTIWNKLSRYSWQVAFQEPWAPLLNAAQMEQERRRNR